MTAAQAQETKNNLIIAGNHWLPFIEKNASTKGILFDLNKLALKSVGYSMTKKILPPTRT